MLFPPSIILNIFIPLYISFHLVVTIAESRERQILQHGLLHRTPPHHRSSLAVLCYRRQAAAHHPQWCARPYQGNHILSSAELTPGANVQWKKTLGGGNIYAVSPLVFWYWIFHSGIPYVLLVKIICSPCPWFMKSIPSMYATMSVVNLAKTN